MDDVEAVELRGGTIGNINGRRNWGNSMDIFSWKILTIFFMKMLCILSNGKDMHIGKDMHNISDTTFVID